MATKLLAAYTVNESRTVRMMPETAIATVISDRVNPLRWSRDESVNITLHPVFRNVSRHVSSAVCASRARPVNANGNFPHIVSIAPGQEAGLNCHESCVEQAGIGSANRIIRNEKL